MNIYQIVTPVQKTFIVAAQTRRKAILLSLEYITKEGSLYIALYEASEYKGFSSSIIEYNATIIINYSEENKIVNKQYVPKEDQEKREDINLWE